MANNPVIRKIKIADVVYDLKDGSVEEQISAAVADIDHPVYVAEESIDTSVEVINADTLGGHPADDFVTKVYVDDKISEVPVGDGLTTEDVQDMIDTSLEGFEGGASSWNDLTDKPFYEEGSGATIIWDGNTEGLESSNSFLGATSYHVSDLTPSIDELIGGNLAFSDGQSLEVAEDWITTLSDDVNMIGELSVFVAYKENATFTHSNTTVVFPKQGVYFTKGNDGVFYTSSLIYGSSIIKTLDEKFIPDTIARKSDITGGAGGVSSWNDLTDKPFGDEITVTNKYLDNFTVEVTESRPHPIPHFPITMGKVYDVTVNGVDYECSPFIVEDVPAIGNSMAMGGSDNGMPFLIGDIAAL